MSDDPVTMKAFKLVATARAVLRSPENVVPLKYVALAMDEIKTHNGVPQR